MASKIGDPLNMNGFYLNFFSLTMSILNSYQRSDTVIEIRVPKIKKKKISAFTQTLQPNLLPKYAKCWANSLTTWRREKCIL